MAKYLDTAKVKTIATFYKTTLPSDITFTKDDVCKNNEQVEKLTREFNIQYRYCIILLIYLLSTRVCLSFSVQKLAKFSSNDGKVHFEGLIHLLSFIKGNRNLGLKHYADMKDSTLSDLLRKANINTENQLMVYSGYSCNYCTYNGRITGSYIIFYQGDPIDHVTHVPGPFDQSSA